MTEATDRAAAVGWARALLAKDDWLILDTETTGLHSDAEIVQIAIAAPSGQILLDTLVKPTHPIPPAATRIHGIRDADVAGAPTFAEIAPQLRELLSGTTVVIYNADYDERLMEQSAQAHGLTHEVPIFGADKYDCAMQQYAAYCAEWSDYHGGYRYQQLPGGDHTALGDCRATLALVKRMAGVCNAEISVPVMDEELRGYEVHHSKFYIPPNYRDAHESPLADALSAFVADLVSSYTDRAGDEGRQAMAHAWLDQWRRDLGWRPAFERTTKGDE